MCLCDIVIGSDWNGLDWIALDYLQFHHLMSICLKAAVTTNADLITEDL